MAQNPKITIAQTQKAISIIRRYKDLERSRGLIRHRLNQRFGIKDGQSDFLMMFVANERYTRKIGAIR